MAEVTMDSVQNYYDRLVRQIIKHLNDVLNSLKKTKDNYKKGRETAVADIHVEQKEKVEAKKTEMGRRGTRNERQQIAGHIRELETLINQEIEIGRGIGITYEADQKRIQGEIDSIQKLLDYVRRETRGRGWEYRFNIDAMIGEIEKVIESITTRQREEKITKQHLELKRAIEAKSSEIIKEIDGIINRATLPTH